MEVHSTSTLLCPRRAVALCVYARATEGRQRPMLPTKRTRLATQAFLLFVNSMFRCLAKQKKDHLGSVEIWHTSSFLMKEAARSIVHTPLRAPVGRARCPPSHYSCTRSAQSTRPFIDTARFQEKHAGQAQLSSTNHSIVLPGTIFGRYV